MRRSRLGKARGFTLIEIIIVLAVIGILVGIALPQYKNTVIKAREDVLRENLFVLRKLIDQYAQDKGKYPPSLQALVDESYLRSIPFDPITRSATTWVPVMETYNPDEPIGNELPGVIDVKSGSDAISPVDKTPYNTW